MNYELLRQVRDAITDESNGFYMGSWFSAPRDPNVCGTAACIAGHAIAIAKDIDLRSKSVDAAEAAAFDGDGYGYETLAGALLGMTPDQTHRLFYMHNWDTDLRDPVYDARTTTEARTLERKGAVEMIDRIMRDQNLEAVQ